MRTNLLVAILFTALCNCLIGAENRTIEEIRILSRTPQISSIELIEQFKIAATEDTKVAIINALGDLRAPVSVNFLVANISYTKLIRRNDPLHGTIAAGALIKIGTPCVSNVVEKVKTELDEADRVAFSRVLYGIYGAVIAKSVLEREIASVQNSEVVGRIRNSIEIIGRWEK